MTLLRLSPDGERLRRIAKAHAAGELSTPDYRRIRSDVIESFALDGAGDLTGDDTQQRWLERPAPLPPIADRVDDDLPSAPEVLPQRSRPTIDAASTSRRPSRPLLWLAAGFVIAIVIAAAIA
jgi:hypothetical protein